MLRTEQLGFWYQDPQDALYKDVELNFEAGKMYAILGASGSGKTTFLSLISGRDGTKRRKGILSRSFTEQNRVKKLS